MKDYFFLIYCISSGLTNRYIQNRCFCKDLVAYFCGLTEIKFSTFILIATFARIPGIWGSTAGGSAMGDKSYITALIIMAIVFAFTAIGILIYSLIVKKHGKKKENSSQDE